jgi:transcriptional regulator with XRE-family HTH domain
MVAVGRQVRRIRREQDLTQTDLGAAAGMARNTINKIERGHMNPSAESVARIAAALGVPVGTLYEQREPVPLVGAPQAGREELTELLGSLGSKTSYLADADVANSLSEMDIVEALDTARAVAEEAHLIGPELRRRYEAAPRGSQDLVQASLLLGIASARRQAVRWSLRALWNRSPEPVPPAGADRNLAQEYAEIDSALVAA